MNAATAMTMAAAPVAVIEYPVFSCELFDRWTAYIDAMPKTVETYTRNVRYFGRYLQEMGICNPTERDVIAYKESLIATKKPGTVQGYMNALKVFFKWTAKMGLYPNIAEDVKNVKVDMGHKRDPLTPAQASALLKSVDRSTLSGKRDYAILALMLTTGIRTISVIRANVEDLRNVGDASVLFYQGKGHEEKAVYVKLTAQVEDAIREYLNARGKVEAGAPLFASAAHQNIGGRMTTQAVSGIAKSALRRIGLDSERLTAHSLRHTNAEFILMAGGSLEDVRRQLDHSNINTTRIYLTELDRAKSRNEQRVTDMIEWE